MKQKKLKKLLILNAPYVLFALMGTKLGLAMRLAPGVGFQQKAQHIIEGLAAAFQDAVPSFHPLDLCAGIVIAGVIRLAVYVKGKNAKKYRKDVEYGSARWGTSEDIAPYIDPLFQNNVILTQTERLTMSSRPKDPKTARNKNVLIIGGSGSGKTRFWLKPNLMQMHSSYVITDPKGYNVPRQTQRNDAACRKILPKGASTTWQQRQTRSPPYMSDCPVTMSSRVRATAS